jgi:hypothetical protein
MLVTAGCSSALTCTKRLRYIGDEDVWYQEPFPEPYIWIGVVGSGLTQSKEKKNHGVCRSWSIYAAVADLPPSYVLS